MDTAPEIETEPREYIIAAREGRPYRIFGRLIAETTRSQNGWELEGKLYRDIHGPLVAQITAPKSYPNDAVQASFAWSSVDSIPDSDLTDDVKALLRAAGTGCAARTVRYIGNGKTNTTYFVTMGEGQPDLQIAGYPLIEDNRSGREQSTASVYRLFEGGYVVVHKPYRTDRQKVAVCSTSSHAYAALTWESWYADDLDYLPEALTPFATADAIMEKLAVEDGSFRAIAYRTPGDTDSLEQAYAAWREKQLAKQAALKAGKATEPKERSDAERYQAALKVAAEQNGRIEDFYCNVLAVGFLYLGEILKSRDDNQYDGYNEENHA